MSETKFLIGHSGLDMQDDFYPDDLPQEWRFDYYSTMFKSLSLPIDTDEDLDQIFEELESFEDEFELVLSIEQEQLLDENELNKLLKIVSDYKDQFTLFCEIDKQPNSKIMNALQGYQLCFQSYEELKFDLKNKKSASNQLYFNNLPVFYSSVAWDDKQIKSYLEEASGINTRTVLICKYAESETLNKIRIIAELLGF